MLVGDKYYTKDFNFRFEIISIDQPGAQPILGRCIFSEGAYFYVGDYASFEFDGRYSQLSNQKSIYDLELH